VYRLHVGLWQFKPKLRFRLNLVVKKSRNFFSFEALGFLKIQLLVT